MQLEKLELSRRYLESIDEKVISRNDDRVVVVLGDEGVGKSTFMLQLARLWKEIRDDKTDPESVLEGMVWGDRDAFTDALRERPEGSIICVQDAPHVLFRREAMHGEQIAIEKNLLDIRIKNFLIVLGFQDFDDVPTSLVRRRAENVLHIPRRGVVRGFNRESIEERRDSGQWPDPDFEDRFPDLEATELWARFQERDREAKLERLDNVDEPDPEDVERNQKIKTVLRAIYKNDMTQKEAGDLVGRSQRWVSERKQELENGEHTHLFDEEESAFLPISQNDLENRKTAAEEKAD